MAIGSQPTVLDRLKERLVVALGKSQDKRVQCGLGRIEDQLPPPCSPARRPRSASICSVSLPDTKQIVQESLGQGLPIIPFGFPSFVIVDLENEPDYHDQNGRQHKRASKILEEPGSLETEESGRKKPRSSTASNTMITDQDNSVNEKREGPRKKKDKEKTKRMLARLRKPVSRQDEWRMEGHNKTDYMFLDFSK